jgi:hypothetical protein
MEHSVFFGLRFAASIPRAKTDFEATALPEDFGELVDTI